jgi:hypothetical protein
MGFPSGSTATELARPVLLSSTSFTISTPCAFKQALRLAHVGERSELLGVTVPARVESQYVLVEHALKEADGVIAVLQDEPVL